MSNHVWHFCALTLGFAAITACSGAPDEKSEDLADNAEALTGHSRTGAVFTMSNAANGNSVLAFERAADGSLEAAGETPTGGLGTGASLGSQGSVTLSGDNRFLLVVDAGSNEISAFAVHGTHLTLKSKVASGGMMPTSVTERDHLVYVLNAGSTANISGLWLDPLGHLTPIAGSTRALSAAAPAPAQVAIAPRGLGVVVTEKGTNLIDVFDMRRDGTLGTAQSHASSGGVPYGFGFSPRGTLVVSEAMPGAVSSYSLSRWHGFMTTSASVPDNQKAPCWVVVTQDGRFAYTANAGSQSISGYSLSDNGSLQLLDSSGVTGSMGQNSKPLDMAVDGHKHLYVVDAGNHALDGFEIGQTGILSPVASTGGMPDSIVGVAAM